MSVTAQLPIPKLQFTKARTLPVHPHSIVGQSETGYKQGCMEGGRTSLRLLGTFLPLLDRCDLLSASLASHVSTDLPSISAILSAFTETYILNIQIFLVEYLFSNRNFLCKNTFGLECLATYVCLYIVRSSESSDR